MDTLLKHNKEIEDELFGLLYDEYGDVGKNGNIKDFITTQSNKSLLKKIAKGEIEKLKTEIIDSLYKKEKPYTEALQSKFVQWEQVLQDLEK